MTKTWAIGFVVLVAICGAIIWLADVTSHTGDLLMAVGAVMFFWLVGGFIAELRRDA